MCERKSYGMHIEERILRFYTRVRNAEMQERSEIRKAYQVHEEER